MSKELLQQAIDALEYHTEQTRPIERTGIAINMLRDAITKPANITEIDAAVMEERQSCALVCLNRYMGDNTREDMEARRCADAILARKKIFKKESE